MALIVLVVVRNVIFLFRDMNLDNVGAQSAIACLVGFMLTPAVVLL